MKLNEMAGIVHRAVEEYAGEAVPIPRPALCVGIQALFEEIKRSSVYQPVRITNFGVFKVRQIRGRYIKNKMTKGLPIYVPDRDFPGFTPAKAYKQLVSAPKTEALIEEAVESTE